VDHLCEPCAEHFSAVRALLDELGVAYVLDHRLVRGLDYYTRTTFEFFVAGREGQQQALGGGGRYDGLAELLGGRPTAGIGFGIGIDRVLLAAEEQGVQPPAQTPLVAVVSAEPEAFGDRLRVASVLREAGLRVRPDGSGRKLGKQLESAAKAGAAWAVVVGEELERGRVGLKYLETGEQREVELRDVAPTVNRRP
jgi:histidyl-tRNA synthetase